MVADDDISGALHSMKMQIFVNMVYTFVAMQSEDVI